MATIFDGIFNPQTPDVLAQQRATLQEQLRQAAAVSASPANRGAANPLALTQAVAQGQSGARAANASQFAQQLQSARQADREMGMRLLGTVGNAAGAAIGMALPGAGPAMSPIAGALGTQAAKAPLAVAGGQPLPQQPVAPQPAAQAMPAAAHPGQAPAPQQAPQPGLGQQLANPAPQVTQNPQARVMGGQPVQWPWLQNPQQMRGY